MQVREHARKMGRQYAIAADGLRRQADALFTLDPQDPLQPAHEELYRRAKEFDDEVDKWASISARRI